MIPSAFRLKKKAEFSRAMQAGKKVRIGIFLVFFLPINQPNIRLGLIVTKKLTKKSVERNKLRRQISISVYSHLKSAGVKVTGDMVLMVLSVPDEFKEVEKNANDLILWLKKQSLA